MSNNRIYAMSFASVYPHYVTKAEGKGRTKAEVDEIIRWLTGYSQKQFEAQLEKQIDFETFFAEAPKMNASRALIKGVVCGVRVEEIEEPLMREIRYLDKMIDELAKGKAMEKILRGWITRLALSKVSLLFQRSRLSLDTQVAAPSVVALLRRDHHYSLPTPILLYVGFDRGYQTGRVGGRGKLRQILCWYVAL